MLKTFKNVEVHNGKILVLPDPDQDLTEGGVALPDTSKEKSSSGIVVMVCKDYLDRCNEIMDGEVWLGRRVVYPSAYGHTEVKLKLEADKEKRTYHLVEINEITFSEDAA